MNQPGRSIAGRILVRTASGRTGADGPPEAASRHAATPPRRVLDSRFESLAGHEVPTQLEALEAWPDAQSGLLGPVHQGTQPRSEPRDERLRDSDHAIIRDADADVGRVAAEREPGGECRGQRVRHCPCVPSYRRSETAPDVDRRDGHLGLGAIARDHRATAKPPGEGVIRVEPGPTELQARQHATEVNRRIAPYDHELLLYTDGRRTSWSPAEPSSKVPALIQPTNEPSAQVRQGWRRQLPVRAREGRVEIVPTYAFEWLSGGGVPVDVDVPGPPDGAAWYPSDIGSGLYSPTGGTYCGAGPDTGGTYCGAGTLPAGMT